MSLGFKRLNNSHSQDGKMFGKKIHSERFDNGANLSAFVRSYLNYIRLHTKPTLCRTCNNKFSNFTFMLPCIATDFFLNNQPDPPIIPIFFSYKTLHVSGIFSAHHQEFSTVHSALVSFIQLFDDRFQAESGWNSRKHLMMGREGARNM